MLTISQPIEAFTEQCGMGFSIDVKQRKRIIPASRQVNAFHSTNRFRRDNENVAYSLDYW